MLVSNQYGSHVKEPITGVPNSWGTQLVGLNWRQRDFGISSAVKL